MERPNQVLKLITIHLTLFKIMHDYLKEIYFDFCLKNDMPKHNDAYLSAEDYLNGNFQLINSQIRWLGNYIVLWEATNGGEDI